MWISIFYVLGLFKVSALLADDFYKSKCPSVCPCVRLTVCLLLRYHLNVLLPPLPKVGYSNFLEILNFWGKVMEKSGLRFEYFCSKMVLNCRGKKCFLRIFFSLFTPFKRLFAPTSPQIPMSKLLDFPNPWGKLMERSGLRFKYFCSERV